MIRHRAATRAKELRIEPTLSLEHDLSIVNMNDDVSTRHARIDSLGESIRERFSLKDDRGEHAQIDEDLRAGIVMRGTNLWVLMFAIFIASIGLNVNSTAVVIGAMLISPLMGPILGVGYGAGIFDFELIRNALKNLAIATLIALATSTFYFLISPLTTAQSELLARTRPTIWDVMIAFFGGLAGIVAGTRKQKTNVIPGVAIATALMPPLCTAGYGLATRSWMYFLGAFYLFTINCVFIAAAATFVTRAFHLQRKRYIDDAVQKRMGIVIWTAMVVTFLPSLYLAYVLVGQEIFKARATQFVTDQFQYEQTHVSNIAIDPRDKKIDITLVGNILPKSTLADIANRLPRAGLTGAKLKVFQADDKTVDVASLKSTLLGDLYRDTQTALERKDQELAALHAKLDTLKAEREKLAPIPAELNALFPQIDSVHVADGATWYAAGEKPSTEVPEIVLIVRAKRAISRDDQQKMDRWLATRLQRKDVRVVIERG